VFQRSLVSGCVERRRLEDERILEDVPRQIGLRGRQGDGEIGRSLADPPVKLGVDLMNEHAARPAMLDGLADAELAGGEFLHTVEEDRLMPPRQLCNNLLHELPVGPSGGEGPHVFQVAGGATGQSRELPLKVGGEAVDDFGAPAFRLRAGKDVAADFPIMQDEFGIGRERGLELGGADPFFDAGDQAVVSWCGRLLPHFGTGRMHSCSG
jgi:hypothetical protein